MTPNSVRALLETITYARPIHVIRQCAVFLLRRYAVQLLLAVMSVLVYRRHFSYLVAAAAVLAVVESEPFGIWLGPMTLVLYGVLHGVAVVLALHLAGAWLKRLLFVALTGSLSAVVPYFGVASAQGLWLSDGISLALALAVGSIGGAASYWLLVRIFWISALSAFSLLRTVGFCVVATLLAFGSSVAISGFGRAHFLYDGLVLPVAWWFAFSLSLFFAERVNDR